VPQDLLPLLIPIVAILIFALGFIAMRRQRSSPDRANPAAPGAPSGLRPSSGESREAFVRRHWQRPGVVANGVTLVDLYDRIATLEQRLAAAEAQLAQRPRA
jgi:hypothetical protein